MSRRRAKHLGINHYQLTIINYQLSINLNDKRLSPFGNSLLKNKHQLMLEVSLTSFRGVVHTQLTCLTKLGLYICNNTHGDLAIYTK